MPKLRFSGGRCPIGLPSSRIVPELGSTKPAIAISSVVLPEPDGPEQRHEAAARHVQADVVERYGSAIALTKLLDIQGVAGELAHTDSERARHIPGGGA